MADTSVQDQPQVTKEINIVSREEWGALPPEGILDETNKPWLYVLWTYSNSEPCYSKEECIKAMQDLQKRHIEKGWKDIQYSFYIGGDLNIYEGRGWKTPSEIVYPGFSEGEKKFLGLAYLGKYNNQNYPNQEVLELRKDIVSYAIDNCHLDWEYCNLLLTTNLNHFYICGEDLIFEGRGWNVKSDKVQYEHLRWDGQSIDIGYIGYFNRESPPLSVLETRDSLVSDAIIMKHIHKFASYFN